MRDVLTTVLEVAGLAFVSAGFWLLAAPAGLIVTGCCLFAVGYRAADL